MIIGIDIRVLGNPIKSGIEKYAENLISHLIKEGKSITFKLFYSSSRNLLPDYSWLKEPNVKLYKFKYPNNFLFTSSRFFNWPLLDKLVGGADVFFFPHFFISALSPNCKRVTTFHDLSYVHFPEFLTLRKRIWHNFQVRPEWQAKFSDKIIAVSESTKNDLTHFYKIDPTKIKVIYSGINVEGDVEGAPPHARGASSTSATSSTSAISVELANFKREKDLPDRFIFFLGKLEPRKNIISIIRALNNLKANPKYKDVGLVIAGARGWLYGDILKEANAHKGHLCISQRCPLCVNQIIFTNQISDEERFLYYRAADIFIYPSFFEGFGFPPLEAMSCGTPVVASRNSSLPEVVGDAAIMIDPHDIVELELWITKILDDENFSKKIVKKGTIQASQFNWKGCALKTLEVLKGL